MFMIFSVPATPSNSGLQPEECEHPAVHHSIDNVGDRLDETCGFPSSNLPEMAQDLSSYLYEMLLTGESCSINTLDIE